MNLRREQCGVGWCSVELLGSLSTWLGLVVTDNVGEGQEQKMSTDQRGKARLGPSWVQVQN
jgi:hypothetical protein